MENPRPQLYTKKAIVVDLVITALFFAFMLSTKAVAFTFSEGFHIIANPVGLFKHVPWTEAPMWARWAGAAFCDVCLSGVFWMALGLFRVTLVDQLSLGGNKEPDVTAITGH